MSVIMNQAIEFTSENSSVRTPERGTDGKMAVGTI